MGGQTTALDILEPGQRHEMKISGLSCQENVKRDKPTFSNTSPSSSPGRATSHLPLPIHPRHPYPQSSQPDQLAAFSLVGIWLPDLPCPSRPCQESRCHPEAPVQSSAALCSCPGSAAHKHPESAPRAVCFLQHGVPAAAPSAPGPQTQHL